MVTIPPQASRVSRVIGLACGGVWLLVGLGCGDDSGDPPVYVTPVCVGEDWVPLFGVRASESYDYVAVLGPGDDGTPVLLDERGRMCRDATDMDLCAIAVNEATIVGERMLVVTSGDEVKRFGVAEAPLPAFLGEIDSPEEALLVAWDAGYEVSCDAAVTPGARATEAGFEVRTQMACDGCAPNPVSLVVAPDGSVR